jgi:hypothetical protein
MLEVAGHGADDLLDPPRGFGGRSEVGLGEVGQRGAREPSGEQVDRLDLDVGSLGADSKPPPGGFGQVEQLAGAEAPDASAAIRRMAITLCETTDKTRTYER